jgi:hypothetical protein
VRQPITRPQLPKDKLRCIWSISTLSRTRNVLKRRAARALHASSRLNCVAAIGTHGFQLGVGDATAGSGHLRALVSDRFVDGNPVHEAKHWYR